MASEKEELLRRVAEIEGYTVTESGASDLAVAIPGKGWVIWNPLENKAQAFELLEKHLGGRIEIGKHKEGDSYYVEIYDAEDNYIRSIIHPSFSMAIILGIVEAYS